MESGGSVTGWLIGLQAGQPDVAQKLWETYFARLVGLARARLAGGPGMVNDPEDIALSAFNSFYQAAQKGRFPKLNDRQDLWQILVMLTGNKAIDALRRETAAKRPRTTPGPEGSESAVPMTDNLMGHEPTPSFAAEVADQFQHLLHRLGDDELRRIALLKLEGYTNEEIAPRVERSIATVERKLALIRRIWESAESHG